MDGLVQDCNISTANVLAILQSYNKPSKLYIISTNTEHKSMA